MVSDLEIARGANPLPIEEVAWSLGIGVEDLVLYGEGMAKIKYRAFEARKNRAEGFLVLVTGVNPTPYGEGKTVTAIGLTQSLNRLGHKSVATIREPSLGPVFGLKGGAAGGGLSQVIPMEQINLHFTGDMHAVTAAHNLASSLLDNHLRSVEGHKIDINRIFWPRVSNLSERSLRKAVVGVGGSATGITREERFDISAASEVMAILSFSQNVADLRNRLGRIILAQRVDGTPVTAEDIGAAGPMAILLRDALLPNLVQTIEGNPVFVHTGPFANIATGNSSLLADEIALKTADYVVTEAGFGSDMGAEKAFHLKSEVGGHPPDAILLTATVRAMKMHGGSYSSQGGKRPPAEEMARPDPEAVRKGVVTNLARHLKNMQRFGPPVVVAVNRFPDDSEMELAALCEEVESLGAPCVISEVHEKGGEGGVEMARTIVRACHDHQAAGRPYTPLFPSNTKVNDKLEKLVTDFYGAGSLFLLDRAKRDLARLQSWGLDELGVCIAKTQYSFSHDHERLGAPSDYRFPIRELRIQAGAGFIIALSGEMMTMPGLPSTPAAVGMDIDDEGMITGMFS